MTERTVEPGGRTVGEVARLSGVSVRTLHHYDAVGLVTPSGRTASGYRVYSDEDLARLRQVLCYRALDFGLPEIAEMLADPGVAGATPRPGASRSGRSPPTPGTTGWPSRPRRTP